MKKLAIVLFTILVIAFSGGLITAQAGDIKLPIADCPSQPIFIMDRYAYIWHLKKGQISDIYNSASIESLKGTKDWDNEQCPPTIGGVSEYGKILVIPKGFLDNPNNYRTHKQMRETQPELYRQYLVGHGQEEV